MEYYKAYVLKGTLLPQSRSWIDKHYYRKMYDMEVQQEQPNQNSNSQEDTSTSMPNFAFTLWK
jgi:hypothetical protein